MKSTIMEFGFIAFAVIVASFFLVGFQQLFAEGGNLYRVISDFVSNVC